MVNFIKLFVTNICRIVTVFKLVYWTTVLDTTFSFVTNLCIKMLQSSNTFRIILCNFLSYPISYTLSTFLKLLPPHIF